MTTADQIRQHLTAAERAEYDAARAKADRLAKLLADIKAGRRQLDHLSVIAAGKDVTHQAIAQTQRAALVKCRRALRHLRD